MSKGIKIRLALLWVAITAIAAMLLTDAIHAWGASMATLYEPCWMHAGGNYDSERESIALGECLVSDETYIEYSREKDMYVPMRRVECGGLSGFVEDRLIAPEGFVEEINYPVDGDTCKTWESYKALTSKTSRQWKLQQKAVTNQEGFRTVRGRYCVAIGNAYKASVGQWIDIVLEDDTVIPAIVGDIKQDIHTTKDNTKGAKHYDTTEFIVDPQENDDFNTHGDCSKISLLLESDVVLIRTYGKWEGLD